MVSCAEAPAKPEQARVILVENPSIRKFTSSRRLPTSLQHPQVGKGSVGELEIVDLFETDGFQRVRGVAPVEVVRCESLAEDAMELRLWCIAVAGSEQLLGVRGNAA
jgi:hypothetical protein